MANYELGRVGLNLRSAYAASTSYDRLDCVSYEGSSYVALTPNTGVVPTNSAVWTLLAAGEGSDPPWNYPTLLTGSTPGDYGAGRMRYKKIGNHVFVAGSVNVTPGSNIVLFNMPEGYRPSAGTATVLKPTGGSRIARIAIYSNGDFRLEWVKNLSDGSSYTSGPTWVDCSIDFWITGA